MSALCMFKLRKPKQTNLGVIKVEFLLGWGGV